MLGYLSPKTDVEGEMQIQLDFVAATSQVSPIAKQA